MTNLAEGVDDCILVKGREAEIFWKRHLTDWLWSQCRLSWSLRLRSWSVGIAWNYTRWSQCRDHARGQGSSDVGQQRRNVTLGLLTAGVSFWGHHSALLGEGLCVLRASRRQGLVLSSGNQFFTNSATYQHEMIFGGFFKTSLKAVWN